MLERFGKFAILIILCVTTYSSAQLFDSVGGALKDVDLGGALGNTPAATAAAPTDLLTYQVDPAITEQVLQQFIDTLKQTGQVAADQMAELESNLKTNINRAAMQQFIDELFVGEGLRLENFADVIAIYIIASFVVINDMQGGTTTEQDLAVRNQIAATFTNIPSVQQLSDAEKQTAAESLILYVMFLANDWQQALQGTEGYDLATVQGYAKDTLVQSGIDPAQFDFTPLGLVRKGGNQTTPQGGTTPQTTTQQTTTQQTTPPTTISPEVQAQVDKMTPEQIQEMTSGCQAALQDPETAKQQAGGGETGEVALQICQAIVNKAGGSGQPQGTQTTTPSETSNPLNPLGGDAEPFVGTFSGTNISLTLQGANNTYTGELTFNGTPFPVQATANGTALTGTFTSGGSAFNFTATLQDKALTLVSDGTTFNLQKQ
jgi:hypothetical protein